MRKIDMLKTTHLLSIVFIVFGLIYFIAVPIFGNFIHLTFVIDHKIGETFANIFSGIVGTLFAIAGSFLVYASFITQNKQYEIAQIESVYYKMLDYHYENLNQISLTNYNKKKIGKNETSRSAFISMKMQLIEVLGVVDKCFDELKMKKNDDQIIDIAYLLFYYGLNENWNTFIENKIEVNKKNSLLSRLYFYKDKFEKEGKEIFNTNQTYLSAYMRNMYNAIKFIDDNESLSIEQKKKYIKILRAQLSNPELYILYFNVRARFGKKWKENKYPEKYELFTNMPSGYCQQYDHKKYFPGIKYEDDELNS